MSDCDDCIDSQTLDDELWVVKDEIYGDIKPIKHLVDYLDEERTKHLKNYGRFKKHASKMTAMTLTHQAKISDIMLHRVIMDKGMSDMISQMREFIKDYERLKKHVSNMTVRSKHDTSHDISLVWAQMETLNNRIDTAIRRMARHYEENMNQFAVIKTLQSQMDYLFTHFDLYDDIPDRPYKPHKPGGDKS